MGHYARRGEGVCFGALSAWLGPQLSCHLIVRAGRLALCLFASRLHEVSEPARLTTQTNMEMRIDWVVGAGTLATQSEHNWREGWRAADRLPPRVDSASDHFDPKAKT